VPGRAAAGAAEDYGRGAGLGPVPGQVGSRSARRDRAVAQRIKDLN